MSAKRIGLVLSGGGIRGIAHLGVLKALNDAGIRFCHIAGTSAGSIAGALFAEGHDPKTIFDLFVKLKFSKFISTSIKGTGLLSLQKTSGLFSEYLPHNSFEKLKIPLTITATNFYEGKLEYFSKGVLIPAIQASSAIPGIFKPIEIKGNYYVDGGVMDNFPVEAIRKDCDFIIGSSCNNLPRIQKMPAFAKLIERAAILSINADMEWKRDECDVLIEPEGLGSIGIFDLGRAEELYWLAYEAALKKLRYDKVLRSILPDSTKQG